MDSCGPRMAAAGLPPVLLRPAMPQRRRKAEDHGDDRGHLRLRELLTQPRQMPAGNMAGFVRQYADDFIGHLRVDQRAGVDEDALGVDHESVERAIVDDGDLDVLLREAAARRIGWV